MITIPDAGQPFRPVHAYRLRAVSFDPPVAEITVSEDDIRRPTPDELRGHGTPPPGPEAAPDEQAEPAAPAKARSPPDRPQRGT